MEIEFVWYAKTGSGYPLIPIQKERKKKDSTFLTTRMLAYKSHCSILPCNQIMKITVARKWDLILHLAVVLVFLANLEGQILDM